MPEPALTPQSASTVAPATRVLAEGADWTLGDVQCRAGPADPAFEERHERVAMALVVEGSFRYRSAQGSALLYPGALLLGNAGCCFECGHEHGTGDRCLAVHVEREQFAEVAASAAGSSRFAFAAATLPAAPALLPAVIGLETLHGGARRSAAAELVLRFVESIAMLAARSSLRPARMPNAREARRINDALQLVARAPERDWDLASLAGAAAMSKYHFLRCFRRLSGMTPHQYLLARRLHRAARALQSSDEPVAAIALQAGFGDLSTFNQRFRGVFGFTPTRYRA
jgi:AraC family transcriptional regulator